MIKKTTSQPPKEFCARLKECIELSGLSQLEFAEAVGFPQTNISRWKLGNRGIRKSTAEQLANACGITVEQLYSHEPITQITLKAQPGAQPEVQPETPQEFMPSTIEQQTAKPPAAKQPAAQPITESKSKNAASRTRYRNAVKAVADDLRAIIGDSKSTMLAVEYFAAKVEIRLFDDERSSL